METSVSELAALIGAPVQGDPDARVTGVGSVDEARPGDVVLAVDQKFLESAMESDATCIVADSDLSHAKSRTNKAGCFGISEAAESKTGAKPKSRNNGYKSVLFAPNPVEAFAKVLAHFRGAESTPLVGIGTGAVIEPGVEMGENVAIGANCYVGRNAVLGSGCVLFPGVFIGEGARVGENSKAYPGAVVYANCVLGRRVILHAGAVVGADGFGYTCREQEFVKLPHAGTVEIGDDVEIGANSTIDRAKTGKTVIGSGTKIDNLVHIAHNCKIGKNCVIVALVGIAGSVKIGDNVMLAGQAGVSDHVTIEDGCVVAARAGVIGDLSKGSIVSGFPARDHRLEKRVQAARLHLPEVLQRLKALEAEVERLKAISEGGR